FLDGEMDGAEREALARSRADDPELDHELVTLAGIRAALSSAEQAPEPRSDFADRVMAAVARAPLRRRWVPSLRSILSALPAVAVAAVAVLLATWPLARRHGPADAARDAVTTTVTSASTPRQARFRLVAPAAHAVEVAGEWSGWRPVSLQRDADGS